MRTVGAPTLEMRVLRALETSDGPLTCAEIAAQLGAASEYVQDRLKLLLASGQVVRCKSWRLSRPYLYLLSGRTWPSMREEREAYERYIAARDRAGREARKSANRRRRSREAQPDVVVS